MADYPLHLVRRRRLADGKPVTIRPIRAEDRAAEQRFLAGLSPESRRLRFQHPVDPDDASLLEFLTRIDYDRHMAFVCEAADGAIVGNARYLVNPDGRSCEFGVVTAEDWRHGGVARLLMDALIRAAQARRLEAMAGLVLSENREMLDFSRALGFELSPDPAEPALMRAVKRL